MHQLCCGITDLFSCRSNILIACTEKSHSLEKATHNIINQYVSKHTLNGYSLDDYLRSTLGFGIDKQIGNTDVSGWLGIGGTKEDVLPRPKNHFHNPLLTDHTGFTGAKWLNWMLFGQLNNGKSSIEWSQLSKDKQSPGGHYSWDDVRDYYFRALTATDDGAQDAYYAETFRGVGQLMHLIEDMSIPEHTRNESHIAGSKYEDYINKIFPSLAHLTAYLSEPEHQPIFFDPARIGDDNPLAPVRIVNLWDTNRYRTTQDPNVTSDVPSGGSISRIGLSEYTNANFITLGSAFAPGFHYPDPESIVEVPIDGSNVYLKKLGKEDGPKGNGDHVELLAAGRWGYGHLPPSLKLVREHLRMDSNVYAIYAEKLIPRAVGYAAGLLQYFFRGHVYMDASFYNLDRRVHIRSVGNCTPDEAMGPGEIFLSCPDQNYVGHFSVNQAIGPGEGLNLDINIPMQCEDVPFATFKGKLGEEENAVVPLHAEYPD